MGWESLVLRAGSPTSPRLQVHTLTEEWWFTDSNIYSNNSPSPNERWRNWWKHLLLIWRLITHKSETLTIFSIMYRVYVMKTMNWVFFIVSNDNGMFSNNTFVKLCKIYLQNCRSTGKGWRTVELQLRSCNKCVFIAHGFRLIKLI